MREKVCRVAKSCALQSQGHESGVKLGDANFKRRKGLKNVSKIEALDEPEKNNYASAHNAH